MPAQDVGGLGVRLYHVRRWRPSPSAPSPCRACAAASSVPVPIGLVRIRASPGARPLLRSAASRDDEPVDGEAERELRAFAGVAADQGAARLAQHVVRPRHHGGEVGLDLGLDAHTARWRWRARSAARRPWRRCRRANGWRRSSRTRKGRRRSRGNSRRCARRACRRRRRPAPHRPARRGRPRRRGRAPARWQPSARVSTVAPTLAPQPPHRMARAEISLSAARSAIGDCACGGFAISGSTLNLRMKRRSIQSFQRHTQAPWTTTPLRVPTA